jgi:sec-independent protein translocase protein TatA
MELLVVAIIALIVLGPQRLPEFGRSVGRGLREFKAAVTTAGEPEREDYEPEEIRPVAVRGSSD